MQHPDYSATLLDHFRHPRNVGQIERPDAEGLVVSPIHGDRLRLTFSIAADRIREVRFQCSGCAVAIAAGSVATTLLAGRSVAEALALGDEEISAALGGVPKAKQRCSLIVGQAVRQAFAGR